MWIIGHDSSFFPRSGPPLSQELREKFFNTSIDILEASQSLRNNSTTAKWRWLFSPYMEWESILIVLTELCVRAPDEKYDRAWRVIDSLYQNRMLGNQNQQKGMLWKPIRRLIVKAKARCCEKESGGACTFAMDEQSIHSNQSQSNQAPSQTFDGVQNTIGQMPMQQQSLRANPNLFSVSLDGSENTGLNLSSPGVQQLFETTIDGSNSQASVLPDQTLQADPMYFDWTGRNTRPSDQWSAWNLPVEDLDALSQQRWPQQYF